MLKKYGLWAWESQLGISPPITVKCTELRACAGHCPKQLTWISISFLTTSPRGRKFHCTVFHEKTWPTVTNTYFLDLISDRVLT